MAEKEKVSKALKEKLFLKRKNGYTRISEADEKACGAFAEDYKAFLDKAKTEREACAEAVELLKANGFTAPTGNVYESKTSKTLRLQSPSGFCIVLIEHLKNK